MKKAWILIYAVVLLVDVIGLLASVPAIHVYCKPLLMPLLMVGLVQNQQSIGGTKWIWVLAGLGFSWAGDIFLLWEDRGPMYFIFGLVSFLLAHICYIIYFLVVGASPKRLWSKHSWRILVTVGYGIGLVTLLFPGLGVLKVPVVAYAAVLVSMLVCGLSVLGSVNKNAYFFFMIGAICFVTSDSILAINRFYNTVPLAGVIIMMTYGIAQWLLATGTLLNSGKEPSVSQT